MCDLYIKYFYYDRIIIGKTIDEARVIIEKLYEYDFLKKDYDPEILEEAIAFL